MGWVEAAAGEDSSSEREPVPACAFVYRRGSKRPCATATRRCGLHVIYEWPLLAGSGHRPFEDDRLASMAAIGQKRSLGGPLLSPIEQGIQRGT